MKWYIKDIIIISVILLIIVDMLVKYFVFHH